MVRFIHTADWQLGYHRAYLDDDAQARFTQARIDVIGTIGDVATAEGAELVVVAGDVFESNQMDRRTVVRALEQIGAIGIPVVVLPGNHDALDAASIYHSRTFLSHRPDNLTVLDDAEIAPIVDGVEIIGLPWTSNQLLHDVVGERLASLTPTPVGVTRIMVAHGVTDELQMDRHNPAVIDTAAVAAALSDGRIHYLALGDRHSTTPIGTTGRIYYSGAPEPTRFTEIAAGNVLSVQVDATECHVSKHRTGRWRFAPLDVELGNETDVDALAARLGGIEDVARTIARVKLRGVVSLRVMAQLEDLLEEHRAGLACLDVVGLGTELIAVADDHDLAGMDVGAVTRSALEDLSERASMPGEVGATATRALGLLYRMALRQGVST